MHMDDAFRYHLKSDRLTLFNIRLKSSAADKKFWKNGLKRVFCYELHFFYNALVLDYTLVAVDWACLDSILDLVHDQLSPS